MYLAGNISYAQYDIYFTDTKTAMIIEKYMDLIKTLIVAMTTQPYSSTTYSSIKSTVSWSSLNHMLLHQE